MKCVMCVIVGFYLKVIVEIFYVLNMYIICKNESIKIFDMKFSVCLLVRDSLIF